MTGRRRWAARVRAADETVDSWFHRLRGRRPVDRAYYTASALADHSLLWHLVSATQALRGRADLVGAVRLSAGLGVESAVVNLGFKSLVRRSRPVPAFERPFRLRVPLTSSFPSGHASAAFFAASLLTESDRRRAPLYYGLATFVATSRIHVRIHHASDVAVGAVVGTALAAAYKRAVPLAPLQVRFGGARTTDGPGVASSGG